MLSRIFLLLSASISAACGLLAVKVANLSEHVQLKGRFDLAEPLHPRADWPGTGFAFSVLASEPQVEVELAFVGCEDNCNFYVHWGLNCTNQLVAQVTPEQSSAVWAFEAVPGRRYDITVLKRTEASCSDAKGAMVFGNLTATGASFVEVNGTDACFARDLRLLVIGDSVTAGYGDEGTMPCVFSADTESVLEAWAVLTAEALNADVHTVAFSGKGVVRNYGDPSPVSSNPMPLYYDRILAMNESTFWNASWYSPHLVAVMLGSNDYSTEPQPSDGQFIGGLVSFLLQIRRDYPDAQVAAICSPHHIDPQCENIAKAAASARVHYIYVDDSAIVSYGCDYHPSLESQRNTANIIIPQFQAILGL